MHYNYLRFILKTTLNSTQIRCMHMSKHYVAMFENGMTVVSRLFHIHHHMTHLESVHLPLYIHTNQARREWRRKIAQGEVAEDSIARSELYHAQNEGSTLPG